MGADTEMDTVPAIVQDTETDMDPATATIAVPATDQATVPATAMSTARATAPDTAPEMDTEIVLVMATDTALDIATANLRTATAGETASINKELQMTESMSSIFESCRRMTETNRQLIVLKQQEKIAVCSPRDSIWFEVEQAEPIGFDARISVTEYRTGSYTTLCCGSAWEASATITQRLFSFNT